ncbi:DUF3318 domain-containing protein [Microcoleus sp. FACHB-1515]|uniref:DUF3318 domain-containing protein n=1 Tax=Cyanophyceae TaxID=3028117 RepID=UPI001F54974E|nr:DUF3318 domain-containing protein [Microcoleus sp. FACHB-1515]
MATRPMNPEPEIYRLIDLMPAAGRMHCEIAHHPAQATVIATQFPLPGLPRSIRINFNLWNRLPTPQRDLLLLRSVAWLTGIRWLQFDLYQVFFVAGGIGATVELLQGDTVGFATAAGFTALAATQLWRNNRKPQRDLEADAEAVRLAQRRGYSQADAVRHLLSAIESIARIENRPLSFSELIRCQSLRSISGVSAIDR